MKTEGKQPSNSYIQAIMHRTESCALSAQKQTLFSAGFLENGYVCLESLSPLPDTTCGEVHAERSGRAAGHAPLPWEVHKDIPIHQFTCGFCPSQMLKLARIHERALSMGSLPVGEGTAHKQQGSI